MATWRHREDLFAERRVGVRGRERGVLRVPSRKSKRNGAAATVIRSRNDRVAIGPKHVLHEIKLNKIS